AATAAAPTAAGVVCWIAALAAVVAVGRDAPVRTDDDRVGGDADGTAAIAATPAINGLGTGRPAARAEGERRYRGVAGGGAPVGDDVAVPVVGVGAGG